MGELEGYLKRNKLDEYIDETDRNNIFNAVDPKHEGSIPINSLLKTTEEQEFHDSEHRTDMLKIRDFLAEHVEKNRAAAKGANKNVELETIKKKKAVDNEHELMKMALGTRTFDLDISADELHGVISNLYNKFPNDESHRKFARFLKLSNLNLDTIPFYDMRKEHLDALKHRAAVIEQTLHSDEVQHKFEELSATRWRGSLATSQSVGTLQTGSPLAKLHHRDNLHGSPVKSGAPHLRGSSSPDQQAGAHNAAMSMSRSMPSLSLSPAKLPLTGGKSLLDGVQVKPRNLALHSARGVDIADHHSAVSRSAPSLLDSLHDGGGGSSAGSPSSKSVLRALRLKEELFEQQSHKEKAVSTDFYAQVVDGGSSMGRVKDPTKVMRIEKIDSLEAVAQGRRNIDKGPTDWTRVGIGGDRAPDDIGYGNGTAHGGGEVESRFSTTNSEFYKPLIYEPSKPVARHGISEAAANVIKRDYRRKERHARTAANLDVTRTRLEYEIMEKEMRNMRNQHTKAVDCIRYETAMLLNDLQCYKRQPLQRMNRKPNLTLSDRMWGGNQDAQTVVLVPENRDFNTTYNSSFQSSSLLTTLNRGSGDDGAVPSGH